MSELYSLSSEGVSTKIEYSGTNAIYIGETPPGNTDGVNEWRIKKYTYDVSGKVTNIQWASAESINFTVNWTDRTTYTYS